MNPGKAWDDSWQLHHVKPIKFGGTNDFRNLVPVDNLLHSRLNSFWSSLMYLIAEIGSKW
jgi:hypothetical protein